MKQANELDEMRRKEEQLRTAFFRQLNSRFIAQVKQAGESKKCRMSDEDWKTIYTHADAVFDNFTVRLRHRFPSLNEDDIRYCCMVRMHLSQAEIAGVVCLEKDSVKTIEAHPHRKLASAKGATLEDVPPNYKMSPSYPASRTWNEKITSRLENNPPQYTPVYPFGTGAPQLTLHRIRPSCRDCRKGTSRA